MKDFLFSVIIPAYNAEKYLKECIESVIHQTVGMKNIQIIIVNDGSTDNTKEIASNYVMDYPENILYLKQENAGVSAARNFGLLYAKGKIINFLDADDKWMENAFEIAKKILLNADDIDVVAFKMEYFDAKNGCSHPLNYKFKNNDTKTINIFQSPSEIQMHTASCFIKKESIGETRFIEGLKYGEDSVFITSLILKKKQYAVSDESHYFYRKREDESSAIDGCWYDKNFYLETLKKFHCLIPKISREETGMFCKYAQYVLMYDLQWRLKRKPQNELINEKENNAYIQIIINLIRKIDDDVIVKQRNIGFEYKILALSVKYRKDIGNDLTQIKNVLYYKESQVFSASSSNIFKIAYIYICMENEEKELHIEMLSSLPMSYEDYRLYIDNKSDERNSVIYPDTSYEYKKRERECFYGNYFYERYFHFKVPLTKKSIKLEFCFSYKWGKPIYITPGFTDTCRLNTSLMSGYLKTNGKVIRRESNQIIIEDAKNTFLKEFRYDKDLWKHGTWKIALFRMFYYFWEKTQRKEIWIISDREDAAGDNGEIFFDYMQTKENADREVYFAISKSSEDYERMEKMGKVLDIDSVKYKLKFLSASKIISSQANDITINPFKKGKRFMKDLYKFKFAFLQHGIIKDDLSSWLNRMNKDISLFVTSSEAEYSSVVQGDYYYGKDIVKLTGLARHDVLKSDSKEHNTIAIIPTWRHWVAEEKDFKNSNFFRFYNNLLHNERLLETLEEKSCTVFFCLHPLLMQYAGCFDCNDRIEIAQKQPDYQTLFRNCGMLVTDYSSVFFDCAIIEKPIVYTQFDKKEFFKKHSYEKGYFDYERDGFGVLCKTEEETVSAIIDIINKGFIMDDYYKQRVRKFFLNTNDGKNRERIYNAICKIPD